MTDVITLPMLSLPDLVVLPGMVVPVELDGDAAPVIDAARAGSDGRLLLAPRLADRYPTYGVIATIEQVGRLPGGARAAVLRAGERARIGSGVPGPGAALWVEAETVEDRSADTTTCASWPRSTRRSSSRSCSGATPGRSSTPCSGSPTRPSWPTWPATRRTSTDEQKRELLETPDVGRAADDGARLGARPPRRARGHREDPRRRPRGHGQEPARVPAAPAARRDPQGARRGRARGRRRLPRPRRGRRPAREGPRGGDARGRQARARQRPEPRGRLDPHLARHRAGAAVVGPHHGHHRHRRRPRDPRRRPPRSRRREGPHRRVPRRARPPRRAWPGGRRRPWLAAPCSRWSVRPVSARPRWASRSPARSAATSSGWPSAASATRPRSAATGAPTSARCPAASSAPSPRPAR